MIIILIFKNNIKLINNNNNQKKKYINNYYLIEFYNFSYMIVFLLPIIFRSLHLIITSLC